MTFEDLRTDFAKRGFDVHTYYRGKSGACHLVASIRSTSDYGNKKCRTFFGAKINDENPDHWIQFKFSVSRSALASSQVRRLTNDPEDFLLQAGLYYFKRFLLKDDSQGRSGDYLIHSGSSKDEFIMHDPAELRSEVARVKQEVLDLLWQNRHRGTKRTSKQAIEDAVCAAPTILDAVLSTFEERKFINGVYGSSGIKITVDGEVELENMAQRNTEIHAETQPTENSTKSIFKYDVFISHASEDKKHFVRPLAHTLQALGLKVWYDEFTLNLGDSLRRSIDRGLAESRYGVAVLSHHFFSKEWPQSELDGLFSTKKAAERRILPVWHKLSVEEVKKYSPMLSDLKAADSANGVEAVAKQILKAVNKACPRCGEGPIFINQSAGEAGCKKCGHAWLMKL